MRTNGSEKMKVSYLGLRELLVSREIDMNEMIFDCQLPKNVLHDINTSTKTYPIYIRRICKYLGCGQKDIISEYSDETRAGVFMPWRYDPAKKLRRQLADFLNDNEMSLAQAGSKAGIFEARLEYFLSYGNLTDREISNLKKLGPQMAKYATAYLDIIVDLRNPDKGDAFESLPMAPLKD